MKRFLMVCLLALGALAASSQPASAWSKFKFSIGANISYTGGGNSLLWGAICGAPYPACGIDGCLPGYGGYAPYPVSQQGNTSTVAQPSTTQAGYYGAYQPVGYYFPSSAGYGFYPAPSYWYGK